MKNYNLNFSRASFIIFFVLSTLILGILIITNLIHFPCVASYINPWQYLLACNLYKLLLLLLILVYTPLFIYFAYNKIVIKIILLAIITLVIFLFILSFYFINLNKFLLDFSANANPILSINKTDIIYLTEPKEGEHINSPITLKGEAVGSWFFEASFPVEIVDMIGNRLGIGYAMTSDEWMTTDFVSFEGTIIFDKGFSKEGFILLQKDNPSGLPQFDDERKIPVKFN